MSAALPYRLKYFGELAQSTSETKWQMKVFWSKAV
jgi:hypothetical protein